MHIIRLLTGIYITARGSLLKTDSIHLRDYWDGQSCLDTDMQLLLVLRRTWYPNPEGCLQRISDSYYHTTTALASLKSRQPQTPSSISMNRARDACWRASPCPAPRVPAAIPPRKRSRAQRPDRFWMAAQFPDRVTVVASHLERGLIWDMQKMIIKAGPAAQLAEHHHAAREQFFLSPTPGASKTGQRQRGSWHASQTWRTLASRARPAEWRSPSSLQSPALVRQYHGDPTVNVQGHIPILFPIGKLVRLGITGYTNSCELAFLLCKDNSYYFK